MKLPLCLTFLLGFSCALFAETDYMRLALNNKGVPKEYVPGLRQLPSGEIRLMRSADGRTPLHIGAALVHHIRSLALVAAGADVEAKDERGRTPLHDLIEHTETVTRDYKLALLELLALAGANLNAVTHDGWTPLALAIKHRDFDFAEYLSWRGAEWSPTGVPWKQQPLVLAYRVGDARILGLVPTAPPPPATLNGKPPLPPRNVSDALLAADLNGVIDALNSGWQVNEVDKKGRSALLRAVEEKRPDLVHLLLFAGANPNLADQQGRTPLMAALGATGVQSDRMYINLLMAGANPTATDQEGNTPLIVAARSGHDWGILALAAMGADPAAQTPRGSVANYVSHRPTLGILARFGVEQTAAPESFEKQPSIAQFLAAAKRGDVEGVRICLDAGVPPDATLGPKDKTTAFNWAINNKRFDVANLLIARGADVNYQSNRIRIHIIHNLAMRYDEDHGNKVGSDAAESIEFLLQHGVPVDIEQADGTTPLMAAAQAGVTGPNTQVLLRAGANINARNKAGLSVLGVAKKYGRPEMVALLEKLGAVD